MIYPTTGWRTKSLSGEEYRRTEGRARKPRRRRGLSMLAMLYHRMAYQIIVGRGVPAESVLREKLPTMRSATSVAKRIVVMVAVRLRLEKIDDLVFNIFLEDPSCGPHEDLEHL